MKYYLGLGSNLGERRDHLEQALAAVKALTSRGMLRVSPLYETPALLPPHADVHWNQPFLNLVCELESDLVPQSLLEKLKQIEVSLGRQARARWAPREIDIDLLLGEGQQTLQTETLQLPHPGLLERAFVLDPLKDLNPSLRLPGGISALGAARELRAHQPLWMAILNTTPDSFSDGGVFFAEEDFQKYLDELEQEAIGILDIGGESTRPGASVVSADEEWRRVEPALRNFQSRYGQRLVRPLLSLDTRHVSVAEQGIELGADILNDVSGLADDKFLTLLKNSNCQYVLMHSLSIPADPKVQLAADLDPVKEVKDWFSRKLERILAAGISQDRIILDPGIGFGKNRLQSLQLIRGVEAFHTLDCRVLIGHSRKSFLQDFTKNPAADRDIESVGVSLALIQKGVTILRVHNPSLHIRAMRGFTHAETI